MAKGFQAEDRTVLRLTGADCRTFLQDLITNDIGGADDGLIYAALLSPQGKYLFDFFVFARDDEWYLDIKSDRAAALAQRLNMYKLRADVTIEASDLPVYQFWESDQGFADPRHPSLGRRVYETVEISEPVSNWDNLRVAAVIPETGIELLPDETYILEAGFERLHGVDFRKGCYVGQEVTARMKHKTELRKGLVQVTVSADVAPGTEIFSGAKSAGTIFTNYNGKGLAHLRFDRASDPMTAGDASIHWSGEK